LVKDFGLMLEEAKRLGMPLPLTSEAHQLCTATSEAGHGAECRPSA
jgi:3-hydroxyisobutyrate dehydrogenase-like beta-hydroxyacid dehydrogenase